MFKKTENKELTGRNEIEKQNIETLKEFYLSHVNQWGMSESAFVAHIAKAVYKPRSVLQ